MHVVKYEQDRASWSEHSAGKTFEEPMSLPGIDRGPHVGRLGPHLPLPGFARNNVRDQASNLLSPQGVQSLDGWSEFGVPHPVGHRGERQPPGLAETAGGRHGRALGRGDRGELNQEAALPYPGLSRDQRHPGLSTDCRTPSFDENVKFFAPRHQPGPGDRVHGLCRYTATICRTTGPVEQPVHELGRFTTGVDTELPLQHICAAVERAHRGGPVPPGELERHERAVAHLLQRLELHAAVREVEGR